MIDDEVEEEVRILGNMTQSKKLPAIIWETITITPTGNKRRHSKNPIQSGCIAASANQLHINVDTHPDSSTVEENPSNNEVCAMPMKSAISINIV